MSSLSPPRLALPAAGRIIERRRRSRVHPAPDELAVLHLCLAPFVALGDGVFQGATRLLRRLRSASLPRLECLGDGERPAEPVRVEGEIVPVGPAFETPGQKALAVFARSIFVVPAPHRRETPTYTDETRGVDFCIRLPSGETVSVSARDVRLEDPPRQSRSPNWAELARRGGVARAGGGAQPLLRESVLRPGDRVEISGVLVRQVAPQGQALIGRGTPLIDRVVPAPGAGHLWIRRLPPAPPPPRS